MRVKADISVIDDGRLAEEINEALQTAGMRARRTGLLQEVTVTIQMKPVNPESDRRVMQLASKVHLKSKAPPPSAVFVFWDQDKDELELDLEVDPATAGQTRFEYAQPDLDPSESKVVPMGRAVNGDQNKTKE